MDMAIQGSFQVPVTSVPLETEEKSNNNLNSKFLGTEIQFRAPVDLHSLDIVALSDVS